MPNNHDKLLWVLVTGMIFYFAVLLTGLEAKDASSSIPARMPAPLSQSGGGEVVSKAAEGSKPDEYCLLWLPVWWICMTKAEWSGWVQAVGAVVAIFGAAAIATGQFRKQQAAEAEKSELADVQAARRLVAVIGRAKEAVFDYKQLFVDRDRDDPLAPFHPIRTITDSVRMPLPTDADQEFLLRFDNVNMFQKIGGYAAQLSQLVGLIKALEAFTANVLDPQVRSLSIAAGRALRVDEVAEQVDPLTAELARQNHASVVDAIDEMCEIFRKERPQILSALEVRFPGEGLHKSGWREQGERVIDFAWPRRPKIGRMRVNFATDDGNAFFYAPVTRWSTPYRFPPPSLFTLVDRTKLVGRDLKEAENFALPRAIEMLNEVLVGDLLEFGPATPKAIEEAKVHVAWRRARAA